jgi:hypothetical protein
VSKRDRRVSLRDIVRGLDAGHKESAIQANAKAAQLQSLVDALDRTFSTPRAKSK